MNTNIQRWGNSQAIRLPKFAMQTALFKENDTVEIVAKENEIIIRKVFNIKHKTLKERLENFDGVYEFEEWNTGKSVGNEVF